MAAGHKSRFLIKSGVSAKNGLLRATGGAPRTPLGELPTSLGDGNVSRDDGNAAGGDLIVVRGAPHAAESLPRVAGNNAFGTEIIPMSQHGAKKDGRLTSRCDCFPF